MCRLGTVPANSTGFPTPLHSYLCPSVEIIYQDPCPLFCLLSRHRRMCTILFLHTFYSFVMHAVTSALNLEHNIWDEAEVEPVVGCHGSCSCNHTAAASSSIRLKPACQREKKNMLYDLWVKMEAPHGLI